MVWWSYTRIKFSVSSPTSRSSPIIATYRPRITTGPSPTPRSTTLCTIQINPVYWVVVCVAEKIDPTIKEDRILCGPPSCFGIIVPSPEPDQPGVLIVQPTCEPERLKARIGIQRNSSPCVIIESLNDGPVDGVDDDTRRAQVVCGEKGTLPFSAIFRGRPIGPIGTHIPFSP